MTQLIVKPASASNVKRLVQAALEHELRILKVGIEKTTQKLQGLEQQFGVRANSFIGNFKQGTGEMISSISNGPENTRHYYNSSKIIMSFWRPNCANRRIL